MAKSKAKILVVDEDTRMVSALFQIRCLRAQAAIRKRKTRLHPEWMNCLKRQEN